MWVPTRRNKDLPSYLGCLLNPDVVWKCSCAASRDSSALFVSTCLNCTWRKCCCVLSGRNLGFVHQAPIFGICEGVKAEQPGMEGWSWIAVESLAALFLHSPSPGYQNSCWPCHSKPTASAGLLFLLWTCSAPVSQTGQVEKSKQGSGSTYVKALQLSDVIWENLWQCLKPCVVTKLSDASGDRQGLCALCAAQSLTSLGSFKIQATHVHCGINSQVDDPNKKTTIWEDEKQCDAALSG